MFLANEASHSFPPLPLFTVKPSLFNPCPTGPFEVESTLKLHPSVVESAVVGSPDPARDEVVKAFIVLTDAAARTISQNPAASDELVKELQEFCKRNAAPYKYPRKIEFVDSVFLPKTISGKIK